MRRIAITECPAHWRIATIAKYAAERDNSFLNRMLWDISRHPLDPLLLIELNLGVCPTVVDIFAQLASNRVSHMEN